MLKRLIKNLLTHPALQVSKSSAVNATELHYRMIREKPFLHKIYTEWYRCLASAIPAGSGHVLEIGSGGGFFSEILPRCITSNIYFQPDVNVILDAQQLPLAPNSLRAIVLLDVLHHIPNVAHFLREIQRTLQPGGVCAMIEPWLTPWARLVYQHLHHEPFTPEAEQWTFTSHDPLSCANGALAWMVFERDRKEFLRQFVQLQIEKIELDYPFSYLLSGGLSTWLSLPEGCYASCRRMERMLQPVMHRLALFACIVLSKRASITGKA